MLGAPATPTLTSMPSSSYSSACGSSNETSVAGHSPSPLHRLTTLTPPPLLNDDESPTHHQHLHTTNAANHTGAIADGMYDGALPVGRARHSSRASVSSFGGVSGSAAAVASVSSAAAASSSCTTSEPLRTPPSAAAAADQPSTDPLYLLRSPDNVEITREGLNAAAARHGARASIASVTGPARVLLDVSSPTSSNTTTASADDMPSNMPRPTSTPSPAPPAARAERVLDFVALYSYDSSPFLRTSHSTGIGGFDYISGGALSGALQYRVPSSSARPKGEDLPDALEHFVYPAGLRLEVAPTPPLLHSFVLTMATGARMYACVYTKWQAVPDHVLTVVKLQIGESLIDCDDPSPLHLPNRLYGPHSLVFISSYPFYDALTTCLKYMAERFFMVHTPTDPQIVSECAATNRHPSHASSMQLIDAIYASFKDVAPTRVPLAHSEMRLAHLYPHAIEFRDAVTAMCAQQYAGRTTIPAGAVANNDGGVLDASSTILEGTLESDSYDGFLLDTSLASEDESERSLQLTSALRTCLAHCPFLLPAAPFDNLPLLEATSLGALFDALDVAHVIAVWNALLCELPCLFVSAHLSKLTPALEALSALLYPMKWPMVYIPVLPIFLTDVLDAPQPFLIGAPRGVLDVLPEALTNGETNIVLVDLDHNTLCMSGNYEATRRRAAKAAQATNASGRANGAARYVEDPADANPFPDPFALNTRHLVQLLHQQGVSTTEDASIDKMFGGQSSGGSGGATTGGLEGALADLNPFKSSTSTPSLDGAPVFGHEDELLDPTSAECNLTNGPGSYSTEVRHRFLPWNLVWRLFDGVNRILNPLKLHQRDLEDEREREENAAAGGSDDDLSVDSTSSIRVDGGADVSTAFGGLSLLAGLPLNLPAHAWPALLPGLVREWRAAIASGRRATDAPIAHDASLGSALTYLGQESFFLHRFQTLLERAKKPLLLLTTAKVLYSGSDISESETELADEESNTEPIVPPAHIKQLQIDDKHERMRRRTTATVASHHQQQSTSDSSSLPSLTHATSLPGGMSSAASPPRSSSSAHASPRVQGPPPMLRATSASVASPPMLVSHLSVPTAGSTSTTSTSRLTPITCEEWDEDEYDGDTDSVSALRPTRARSTSRYSPHRASDPVLGFRDSHDTPLMHTRPARQSVVAHLAPPQLMPAEPVSGSTLDSLVVAAAAAPASSIPSIAEELEFELEFGGRGRERSSIVNEVLHIPSAGRARSNTSLAGPPPLSSQPPPPPLIEITTADEPDATRFKSHPSVPSPRPSSSPSPMSPSSETRLPLRELASSSPSSSIWPSISVQDVLSIRRRFLSVFVSLLHSHRAFTGFARQDLLSNTGGSNGGYPTGLGVDEDEEAYEVTFETASFLRYVHRDYRPFLSLFLQTQMMKFFSEERLTRESTATAAAAAAAAAASASASASTTNGNGTSTASTTTTTTPTMTTPKSLATPRSLPVATASPSHLSRSVGDTRLSKLVVEPPSLNGSWPSTPDGRPVPQPNWSNDTASTTTTVTLTSTPPPPPPPSVPNDWFDRLCAQKRARTRLLLTAWGENGLAGLLYKLGRKVPTWKERWFELNRHGTIMRYYAHSSKMTELEPTFKELKRRHKLSPRDPITKANLDRVAEQREKLRSSLFRGEIAIVPGQTTVRIPNQTRKYMTCYCFEVVTPTRSLLACAPDLKTRDEWILCIRARASKLSIDHTRIGVEGAGGPSHITGLGTVPHLESRLQMQLRLLREKNIAALTRSFMDNLQRRQQKFIAGDATTGSNGNSANATSADENSTDSQKSLSPKTAASLVNTPLTSPSNAAAAAAAASLSLPHALLVCEHLRTSLDLRKFSSLFRTHQHCFLGREATHYILHQNLCHSLADAVSLCNLMLNSSLILNVNSPAETPFHSDAKHWYTFPSHDLLHGAGGDANAPANSLLPTEEERVIVARMREELDVRDRPYGFFRTVGKDCFVAKDAIAWLLDRGICLNESSAVRLSTRLVRTSQLLAVHTSSGGSSASASTLEFENNARDLWKFHPSIRPAGVGALSPDGTTVANPTKRYPVPRFSEIRTAAHAGRRHTKQDSMDSSASNNQTA